MRETEIPCSIPITYFRAALDNGWRESMEAREVRLASRRALEVLEYLRDLAVEWAIHPERLDPAHVAREVIRLTGGEF